MSRILLEPLSPKQSLITLLSTILTVRKQMLEIPQRIIIYTRKKIYDKFFKKSNPIMSNSHNTHNNYYKTITDMRSFHGALTFMASTRLIMINNVTIIIIS